MTGPESRVAYRLAKHDPASMAWPARRLAASRLYWARPTLWRAPDGPNRASDAGLGSRSIWQLLAVIAACLTRRQARQARA